MIVPAKNIVESLDLGPDDVFLAPFECVSNSILSISNANIPKTDGLVNIELIRGDLPAEPGLYSSKT